jgi:hypothetical protein
MPTIVIVVNYKEIAAGGPYTGIGRRPASL